MLTLGFTLPRCRQDATDVISNYMRLLARLVLAYPDLAVAFLRSAGDDLFGHILNTWLYAVRGERGSGRGVGGRLGSAGRGLKTWSGWGWVVTGGVFRCSPSASRRISSCWPWA